MAESLHNLHFIDEFQKQMNFSINSAVFARTENPDFQSKSSLQHQICIRKKSFAMSKICSSQNSTEKVCNLFNWSPGQRDILICDDFLRNALLSFSKSSRQLTLSSRHITKLFMNAERKIAAVVTRSFVEQDIWMLFASVDKVTFLNVKLWRYPSIYSQYIDEFPMFVVNSVVTFQPRKFLCICKKYNLLPVKDVRVIVQYIYSHFDLLLQIDSLAVIFLKFLKWVASSMFHSGLKKSLIGYNYCKKKMAGNGNYLFHDCDFKILFDETKENLFSRQKYVWHNFKQNMLNKEKSLFLICVFFREEFKDIIHLHCPELMNQFYIYMLNKLHSIPCTNKTSDHNVFKIAPMAANEQSKIENKCGIYPLRTRNLWGKLTLNKEKTFADKAQCHSRLNPAMLPEAERNSLFQRTSQDSKAEAVTAFPDKTRGSSFSSCDTNKLCEKRTMGFQSALDETVNIDPENLVQVKKKSQYCFNSDQTDPSVRQSQRVSFEPPLCGSCGRTEVLGFHTASGKSVNINQKSLILVKSKFLQRFDSDTSHPGKYDENIGENVKQTRSFPVKTCNSTLSCETKELYGTKTMGFQSASGKTVNIDPKSFIEVNKKIQYCFHSDQTITPADKNGEASCEIHSSATHVETEVPKFQTASGKCVNISPKSLNEVKNKFSKFFDYDLPNLDENKNSASLSHSKAFSAATHDTSLSSSQAKGLSETKTLGFQSASGKTVNINPKNLMKVETKFQHYLLGNQTVPSAGRNKENNYESQSFASNIEKEEPRFQSASGKYVNTSPKSLNKVKNKFSTLFDYDACDLGKNRKNSRVNLSHSKAATTHDTSLSSSQAEGLSETKKMGFQSASGKTVNIDPKSLIEIKKKFCYNFHGDQTVTLVDKNEEVNCEQSSSGSHVETQLLDFRTEPVRPPVIPMLDYVQLHSLRSFKGGSSSTKELKVKEPKYASNENGTHQDFCGVKRKYMQCFDNFVGELSDAKNNTDNSNFRRNKIKRFYDPPCHEVSLNFGICHVNQQQYGSRLGKISENLPEAVSGSDKIVELRAKVDESIHVGPQSLRKTWGESHPSSALESSAPKEKWASVTMDYDSAVHPTFIHSDVKQNLLESSDHNRLHKKRKYQASSAAEADHSYFLRVEGLPFQKKKIMEFETSSAEPVNQNLKCHVEMRKKNHEDVGFVQSSDTIKLPSEKGIYSLIGMTELQEEVVLNKPYTSELEQTENNLQSLRSYNASNECITISSRIEKLDFSLHFGDANLFPKALNNMNSNGGSEELKKLFSHPRYEKSMNSHYVANTLPSRHLVLPLETTFRDFLKLLERNENMKANITWEIHKEDISCDDKPVTIATYGEKHRVMLADGLLLNQQQYLLAEEKCDEMSMFHTTVECIADKSKDELDPKQIYEKLQHKKTDFRENKCCGCRNWCVSNLLVFAPHEILASDCTKFGIHPDILRVCCNSQREARSTLKDINQNCLFNVEHSNSWESFLLNFGIENQAVSSDWEMLLDDDQDIYKIEFSTSSQIFENGTKCPQHWCEMLIDTAAKKSNDIDKTTLFARVVCNFDVFNRTVEMFSLCSSNMCSYRQSNPNNVLCCSFPSSFGKRKLFRKMHDAMIKESPHKYCPGYLWQVKHDVLMKHVALKEMCESPYPFSYSFDELKAFGVRESTMHLSADSAGNFVFDELYFEKNAERSHGIIFITGDKTELILDDFDCAGPEELYRAFQICEGVNSVVSRDWFLNHYKQIVLKLACLERSFPAKLANKCLLPDVVIQQLKYRYDFEVGEGRRSALRKIMEQDESAARTVVLFVSSMKCLSDAVSHSAFHIKLSDGWYEISAEIDSAMVSIIQKGILAVGTKIITSGAKLISSRGPCDPLEVNDDVRLKIHTNSTRRCRWDTKLGFYKKPMPYPVCISSVHPFGGDVGCTTGIIVHLYPLMFCEKYSDGTVQYRNEKQERICNEKYEDMKRTCLEKLADIVRTKLTDAECHKKSHQSSNCRISKKTAMIQDCDYDSDFKVHASSDFNAEIQNEYFRRFEKEMDIAISLAKKNGEFPIERHVSCVHKFLLWGKNQDVSYCKNLVLINVWTSSHDSPEFIYEGSSLKMYHLYPSRDRDGFLQLHTSKLSRVENTNFDGSSVVALHKSQRIITVEDANKLNLPIGLPDIDVIGLVFQTSFHQASTSSCVYITDTDSNILAIKFSANCAFADFKDVFQVGNVISACNLIPLISQAPVPVVSSTILSTFSCNPRGKELQEAMQKFKEKLLAFHLEEVIDKSRRMLLVQKNSLPNHHFTVTYPGGSLAVGLDYSIKKKHINDRSYPTYVPLSQAKNGNKDSKHSNYQNLRE